jgi:hypothetical protein
VGTLTQAKKSVTVSVQQGDAVYVLAVNSNPAAQTVKVKISENLFVRVFVNMTVTEVRSFNGSIPGPELAGLATPYLDGTLTGDTFTALCDHIYISGKCDPAAYLKVEVTFNADKTLVTSLTVQADGYGGHYLVEALDIPVMPPATGEIKFQVSGPETCEFLQTYEKTNDTPGNGYDMFSYSCDVNSFITIIFAK